ncbi:hypothetical protein E2C01_022848 [Portunus trituberculatus]|uniref:Uncharacterized protein n=1 Tax=Portunus trituberculatus TaxID=210409 RepID=A0A5B7E8R0_PORTR|nr:hypothetical protein [Portunus trituberculatus]
MIALELSDHLRHRRCPVQVHPVLVRASVLNQWGSQPRDVGSQRQLDVQGFNKPHPHHLPPLQAWPRNSRPHHQGPQYTSSPHPSLPYTRSYLPSPQHSWPHHLRPHHPLPMFRPKPHQRAHPSQAISLSRRARIYAQPKRPGSSVEVTRARCDTARQLVSLGELGISANRHSESTGTASRLALSSI